MHAPFRIALELTGDVVFSTTTRSPAVVLDLPEYPLRHGIVPAHEVGASGDRYAYNVVPGGQDQIVLVLDEDYDTPDVEGLLRELAALAPVRTGRHRPDIPTPTAVAGARVRLVRPV